MDLDTKTRKYSPAPVGVHYQDSLTPSPSAKAVTSDPTSFANDSVRKRWPVILVSSLRCLSRN